MPVENSSMGFCEVFAFVTILCSSFYVAHVNSRFSSENPSYTGTLHYYDSDSELSVWQAMVSSPIDETTSLQLLAYEARDEIGKLNTTMYEDLHRAMALNKRVSGLTRAECLAVTMYTDQIFYTEYKAASNKRNWEPYRVYTTLLMSAIRKLTTIDPIPRGATLYRGIPFRPEPPRASRIFWKAFTSTTLNISIAEWFKDGSEGTILEFQPPTSRQGARIRHLSHHYDEDEILLPPFEAYDFLSARGSRYYFRTSSNHDEFELIYM